MKRLPIQLDEATYRTLKRRAFQEGRSIASIIRESVSKYVETRKLTIDDFSFIASGRSASDARDRVSERHDAALAQALGGRQRRRG